MENNKYLEDAESGMTQTISATENNIHKTYLNDMHGDMHKELTRVQQDLSKGFSKEEIGSAWGKLKSNMKEVFGKK